MIHPSSQSQSEIELHRVLEEIADLISSGGQVDVESYVAAMPEHAEHLRDFVASMQLLADFGDADSMSKPESSRVLEDVVPTSRVLGDFRVLGELGRGGMGIVYEAEQISLERIVALKILPFAAIMDDRQLQRFKNEARAAATLHHPHIVPVFSVGSERGVHYYAMQRIEGASLAELLADVRSEESHEGRAETSTQVQTPSAEAKPSERLHRSSLQPSNSSKETRRQLMADLSTKRSQSPNDYFRTIARWGRETAEALAYAHENGVLHRDIKPGNLMIDGAGRVWITDFGLARIESDASMTMSGDIVGTLRYMAPEQVLGNSALIDHRADVYALGVTLYELSTRRTAFSGTDRHELVHKITTKELLSPRKIDPSIPVDLETIILKAASKAPEDRYTTAREFAEDLIEFLADRPIRAKPPTVVERALKWSRRHPVAVWSAAIILLVITLFSLSGFSWTRHKNSQLANAVVAAQLKAVEANEALGRETVALSQTRSANEQTRQALKEARVAQSQATKNLYLFTIRQAFDDLQHGESARFAESMVRFIPRNGEEDLRDWEWHYLLSLYSQQEQVLLEHVNGVHDVDWHPEGRHLATAGVAGNVCVWNTTDWSLTSRLRLHGANSIDWHPAGVLLAIAHLDNTIRIWDTRTGLVTNEISTGKFPCFLLEFSPDGSYLAAAGRQGGCTVWNTNDFSESWHYEMSDAQGVSWSPDGMRLACSGRERDDGPKGADHTVLFFNASSGEVEGRVKGLTGLTPVRWSPQGDRVATGSFNERIQIFDANSFNPLHSVEVEGLMQQFRWSHDGQYLAAGIGRNVEIFDTEMRRVDTLKGHTGSVLSVTWSADDSKLVAGATDGATLVWPLESVTDSIGAKTVCREFSTGEEAKSFFSRSGRLIATLNPAANEVVVRRVTDGDVVKRFDVELRDSSPAATWGPKDAQLVCITQGGHTVTHLNVATGVSRPFISLDRGEIRDIDWNPIYSQLAISVVDDGKTQSRLEIWDTGTAELQQRLATEETTVNQVAWSPSGTLLVGVVGNSQRHTYLRIWDVRDKTFRENLTGHFRFHGKPVWSPDGSRIAAFGWDGGISIWDTGSGTPVKRLHGHANATQGIWHPAGQRMFTCSEDGTVRLWDVGSGEEILRWNADLESLFISPDRSCLCTAGKQLRLIDIKTDQGSTPNKLLAYAASVKANQRELDEARELMDALPVDSPERRNLLRRLFNQHYWLARSVQAAIDESSPAHLARMLALWEELTDDPKHHDRQSYGMSQDEIATVTLLQCADVAAMRALQYQQDSTAMVAVLEQIISSIEEEIDQLQISAEQRENIPRIINAVHGTRATLLQRRPATTE